MYNTDLYTNRYKFLNRVIYLNFGYKLFYNVKWAVKEKFSGVF